VLKRKRDILSQKKKKKQEGCPRRQLIHEPPPRIELPAASAAAELELELELELIQTQSYGTILSHIGV
jgi:hypothetical protein